MRWQRCLDAAIMVVILVAVTSCSPGAATPRPDAGAAAASRLVGLGFECQQERSPSQAGSQWQCTRGAAEDTLSVIVDATDASVGTVSLVLSRAIHRVTRDQWSRAIDVLFGGPPLMERQELRDWLLEHQEPAAPRETDAVRATVSTTDATTTVVLALE